MTAFPGDDRHGFTGVDSRAAGDVVRQLIEGKRQD